MLLMLVILFAGLYYLIVKKPVVNSLKHEDFPDVPRAGFDEWKTYENSSLNFFIVASLSIFFASLTVGFVSSLLFPITPPAFLQYTNFVFFGLFIILIFISAIQGSKAKRIKTKYGIRSTLGVETTKATSSAYKKASVTVDECERRSKVNPSDLVSSKLDSEQPEFIAPKSPEDQAALAASKLLAFTIISLITVAVGYFAKILFDRYYD